MTPEEFVKGFYLERKSLLSLYFNSNENTEVSNIIKNLKLDEQQTKILEKLINSVLRDAFYTVLLGLDGEASIGNRQETYVINDEKGNELTGGDIEAFAWEYFQNKEDN